MTEILQSPKCVQTHLYNLIKVNKIQVLNVNLKKQGAQQQTLGFYMKWENPSMWHNVAPVNVNVYLRSKIDFHY